MMRVGTRADTDVDQLREHMVNELRGRGYLPSASVARAFGLVPRHLFLPEIPPEAAYRDEAHPIKWSTAGLPISSSSQPAIMASMLEHLGLEPGHRVLEIGAGTGYNAALMRCLVGRSGRVVTIDIDPELASRARAALRRAGRRARVVVGDGRHGFAADAPYDRIVVTASADRIPHAWLDQLRPGGRLQLPIRLTSDLLPHMIATLELDDDALRSVAITWGGFMPLHGGDDGGRHEPHPGTQVNRFAQGAHRSLLHISGPGTERLSDAQTRRLVALILDGPRSRMLNGHIATRSPAPPDVFLYLMQRLPQRQRIELFTPQTQALGILAADGHGASVVAMANRAPHNASSTAPRAPKRQRWWTETYGDGEPDGELDELLQEWRALRRSGRTHLQVEVRRSCTSTNADIELTWEPRGRR